MKLKTPNLGNQTNDQQEFLDGLMAEDHDFWASKAKIIAHLTKEKPDEFKHMMAAHPDTTQWLIECLALSVDTSHQERNETEKLLVA